MHNQHDLDYMYFEFKDFATLWQQGRNIKVSLLHIKSDQISNIFLSEDLFGCLSTKYYFSH